MIAIITLCLSRGVTSIFLHFFSIYFRGIYLNIVKVTKNGTELKQNCNRSVCKIARHFHFHYIFPLMSLTSMSIHSTVEYRRISQMSYQPKSLGKMAHFETLTLCSYLNLSHRCTSFWKDLVTCTWEKVRIPTVILFKLILLPTPCCYGLDVTWNSCIVTVTRYLIALKYRHILK